MGGSYKPKAYSLAKTLWKVAKSTGVLASGGLATIAFPDAGDGPLHCVGCAAPLTPHVFPGVRNMLKNL